MRACASRHVCRAPSFGDHAMPNRLAVATLCCVGLAFASAAHAVTSVPMPEEGFAVAASGGIEGPNLPIASDADSGANLRTPGGARGDNSAENGTRDGAKPERAEPAHPALGSDAATPHKPRGSARWQSLLPGAMK